MEDTHNLVLMDTTLSTEQAKCIIIYNLKYTDEMVERLNLKMLHVTYKHDTQNHVFDLEFANKLECSEAKKMTEAKKAN